MKTRNALRESYVQQSKDGLVYAYVNRKVLFSESYVNWLEDHVLHQRKKLQEGCKERVVDETKEGRELLFGEWVSFVYGFGEREKRPFISIFEKGGEFGYMEHETKDAALSFLDLGSDGDSFIALAIVDKVARVRVWSSRLISDIECRIRVDEFFQSMWGGSGWKNGIY